jgi:hypothetical protein
LDWHAAWRWPWALSWHDAKKAAGKAAGMISLKVDLALPTSDSEATLPWCTIRDLGPQ